jgi:hypothetical protein
MLSSRRKNAVKVLGTGIRGGSSKPIPVAAHGPVRVTDDGIVEG